MSSPPPLLLLPLFQGEEEGWGRRGGGQGRSPLGGLALFAKPASPLSLLSLPSFLYLFILSTPCIRARTCTQSPPRRSRSRSSQHLAQKLLNPKLPQLRQGAAAAAGWWHWWGRRVRCAPMIMTRRMLLRTREQNRGGKGELILHIFLDEFRCLKLKLDKIRCLILN